jgi:hypothetical protein
MTTVCLDDSKTYLYRFHYRDGYIEEDLRRDFASCCNNSLLVNPEKTKMLVVGTRQLMNQLESLDHINFMGENLTPVTEVNLI